MITCNCCGKKVENDNIHGLKYKKKSYCYECFCNSFKPVEVDKHFAYLKFQEIFNRVPTSAEWTQCERLIKEHKWDWQKIEMLLEYVYLVEEKDISEEHGAIGILPFYETKARLFYRTLDLVYESIDNIDDTQDLQPDVIYATNFEHKKSTKIKSIDSLINWEEEDDE